MSALTESTPSTSPQAMTTTSPPPILSPVTSFGPPDGQTASRALVQGLHSRSCVTCRRRKVRCDKKVPCSNCVKAPGTQCIYPSPGRAPRRPKTNGTKVTERESELIKRLRRLEGVVQELSGQNEGEAPKESPPSSTTPQSQKEGSGDVAGTNPKQSIKGIRVVGMDESGGAASEFVDKMTGISERPPRSQNILEQNFGRLVIDEGKSRYLNNGFWSSLSEELEDIRDIFEDEQWEEEDVTSPGDGYTGFMSNTDQDHQSFVMGYSSSNVDLRSLHPLPSQIPFYWQTFLENVEPLTKILHVPTMAKTIREVQHNLDALSRSTEALMFAIYYSTVTSMTESETRKILGAEKSALLSRYRFAVEQALARASFLTTSEIVTVQAMILFLVCVRRHDDSRFIYSLTGLAIRIAQSLGLHRDGTNFGLSPFNTEMRRRLWWHCCTLDMRASEDHGMDVSIHDLSFDTRLPLNINDADLDPEATEPPEERTGVTEMTFPLIRYEICTATRRLMSAPPGHGDCKIAALKATLESKEDMIRDCSERLETKYLQYCGGKDTSPLAWVAATLARLIVAKMSLIIYHPFHQPDMAERLPLNIKERLLVSSIEILEYASLLEKEASTKKWGWLFHTYIQWHAISYILAELCVRNIDDRHAGRAWRAVDAVFSDWGDAVRHSKNGMLWLPMKKLMVKARKKRAADALARAAEGPEELVALLGDRTVISRCGMLSNPAHVPVVCQFTGRLLDPRTGGFVDEFLAPPGNDNGNDALAMSSSRRATADGGATGDDGGILSKDARQTQAMPFMPNNLNYVQEMLLQQQQALHSPMQELGQERGQVQGHDQGQDEGQDQGQNQGQNQGQHEGQGQTNGTPWLMDDSALLDLDLNGLESDDTNWEGWDDLVKDFQMEVDNQPGQRGPNLGGLGAWW